MCSSNSFWGENSWWWIIILIILIWVCCGQGSGEKAIKSLHKDLLFLRHVLYGIVQYMPQCMISEHVQHRIALCTVRSMLYFYPTQFSGNCQFRKSGRFAGKFSGYLFKPQKIWYNKGAKKRWENV